MKKLFKELLIVAALVVLSTIILILMFEWGMKP